MPDIEVLTPIEEKTIIFYDDELTAVKLATGEIFVPVRRLCDNLGLDWAGQRQRINRHSVLREAVRGVGVITTPQDAEQHGGRQEMLCLPLDMIPGWLFGVTASRVRDDIQPKLERYQRECFRVLWEAFKGEILPAVDPALAPPAEALTPAERALALAEAVTAMARQQVTFERWLAHHDQRIGQVEDVAQAAHGRLDRAAEVVGDHSRRLQRIELSLAGGETVTDAQAAAISEAVKALAFELGKIERDRGNPYQRIYSELYRKFRVPSYRALPLEAFPQVLAWLAEWWQQVTDRPAPFAAHAGETQQLD